jgi:hypothetical protein
MGPSLGLPWAYDGPKIGTHGLYIYGVYFALCDTHLCKSHWLGLYVFHMYLIPHVLEMIVLA